MMLECKCHWDARIAVNSKRRTRGFTSSSRRLLAASCAVGSTLRIWNGKLLVPHGYRMPAKLKTYIPDCQKPKPQMPQAVRNTKYKKNDNKKKKIVKFK